MILTRPPLLILLSLSIACCALAPATITANSPQTKAEDAEFRLNNEVVPTEYDVKLTLAPDFGTTKKFTGEITILIKPTIQTEKEINLHGKSLTIDPETFRILDPQNVEIQGSLTYKPDVEMISVAITRPLLTTEEYRIQATFEGVLWEDMYGFYISSYADDEGTQWVATTQFQPTHARRAFPCFDEPNLKATFAIAITHPANYHALSNTEGSRSQPNTDGSITTTFGKTPVMSTYLVAFIVSKFASMSVQMDSFANGVWSRKETVATGKYGFDMAPKILKVMEDFTGVPYSASGLTKLDQVAIPDFAAGAMENWGLVTYRETALLWDPLESTARSKQRVGTVVAHELAHMWFGNLITTDWWDSTWLNEGFARYFEYHATAKVEIDWEVDSQFVVEQHQTILNSDSFIAAQPLTSPAFTPTQISNKFGSLTYSKGGSIVRMIEHFMGSTRFFNAIKTYIGESNRHFTNRKPTDLFAALQQHSTNLPAPMSTILEGWTTRSGFPVLTVTSNDNQISISQQRFLFTGEETTPSRWIVPITYTTSDEPNFDDTLPKRWLPATEGSFSIPDILTTPETWVILNIKSTAFIRVNYDERLWNNIVSALNKENFGSIHVLNRAQLVDDAMNLARAGLLSYAQAFNVLSYLENEIAYYPWYPAFNSLSYLRRRFEVGSDLDNELTIYLTNLMTKLNSDVSDNLSSRKQVDIHKKVLALNWACQLGFENCVETARTDFDSLKEGNPVNPDLRSTVYCQGASQSRENWDFLWNLYKNTDLASEATLILSALGCTVDEQTIEEYLQYSITENSGIRKQDAQSVFSAVISGSRVGVEHGLNFLIQHSAEIIESYGAMGALTSVVSGVADRLTSRDQINRLQAFLDASEDENFKEQAQLAIDNANANIQWAETHYTEILEYLKEKNNPVTAGPTGPTGNPGNEVTTPDSAASITISVLTLTLSIFFTSFYSVY